MGVGRQEARTAIASIKAGTNRNTIRTQMAEACSVFLTWLADYDAKFNGAEKAFAESRPAQFDTFVDSLPDVPVDQTP